ncbi:TetR/AcrR family transcriptional regulator [Streptomyces rubradiris]|uniref:TetR family transcriptional regulator n=1 Tax=Streptomyces rubradiris TaxID=285531 RepID=A0ABQ3R9R0_STRRR|nr:TetR/AcrR family transcriptional regulator [Streptomyces rubradiris]GHH00478.1 TetR family transcriptional regulator [Streptomyces rubradiris]GHI52598.1 TetR family transcriptional regulator [Streptomyces rubradiris]
MSKPEASTPRERYRAQVREEIKKHAWDQIATAGASALSLNAIAKRMGMSGPALYRYFSSRDELITALVKDAYRSLADTFRARAEAGADLRDLAHALREWALADPQRYFLVYGTPVPGYRAPDDTTRIASEIMAVILDACAAGQGPDEPASPLEEHLHTHRAWAGQHPAPPSALRRALAFWTRLHGVLSLELAGQFTGMRFDPARLYTAETESVAHL